MKKAILIFIVTLLFTGCLEEEWDDCNSILWLTFHHKDTPQGFDNTIGNDVHVYVYKNDKYHHTVVIPFEDIEGGQEYPLRKTFTGQLSIAAWAIPKSVSGGVIPDIKDQKEFSTSVIGHNTRGESSSLYDPMADLYLGTIDTYEHVLEDAHHVVSMNNTVCKANIFVDPSIIEPYLSHGAVNVKISGIGRESTLLHKSSGEEISVYAGLLKDSGEYTSDYVGLMPGYKDKNIILTVSCGDYDIFTVDTGLKSVPGDILTIRVSGTIVEIYLNGWKVKTINLNI